MTTTIYGTEGIGAAIAGVGGGGGSGEPGVLFNWLDGTGIGGESFTDPSSLSSASSLVSGIASITLIAGAAGTSPADSPGWSVELTPDGSSYSDIDLRSSLRLVVNNLVDAIGDHDVECWVALLNGSDRTTASGWGTGMGERSFATRVAVRAWKCDAGTWSPIGTPSANPDASATNNVVTATGVTAGNLLRRVVGDQIDTSDGSSVCIIDGLSNMSIDWSAGVWLHYGAYRTDGTGVSPNDVSEDILFRPLVQYSAADSIYTGG